MVVKWYQSEAYNFNQGMIHLDNIADQGELSRYRRGVNGCSNSIAV